MRKILTYIALGTGIVQTVLQMRSHVKHSLPNCSRPPPYSIISAQDRRYSMHCACTVARGLKVQQVKQNIYWNLMESDEVRKTRGSLSNAIVAEFLDIKSSNFYTKELYKYATSWHLVFPNSKFWASSRLIHFLLLKGRVFYITW